MDKNVLISCPLIEHGHFFPCWPSLSSYSMREHYHMSFLATQPLSISPFSPPQIVETLFNALNQNLVQFELKPGVQVIVYVTQLTLGECLWDCGGRMCGDLISWTEKGGYNYQTLLHKCLRTSMCSDGGERVITSSLRFPVKVSRRLS